MIRPLDPDMFARCDSRAPAPMRIGGKWTSKIIRCLEDGPRRFSELQVPLRGVTAKVLTESLRAMERDGMVTRTVYDEVPLRVEYELTPFGSTLAEPLAALCAWSRTHLPQLARARAAYDSAAGTAS